MKRDEKSSAAKAGDFFLCKKKIVCYNGAKNMAQILTFWRTEQRGVFDMAETMKDYEAELEASFKKIEEGDILTGTVVSVDDKEIIVDLKYYAEGIIPVEDYSREPGFNVKEEVHPGDEVSATVVKKDDGNGNILLSKVEATDVLAWDRLRELKDTKEVLDVVVKGVVNGGAVAYVEGVRGFIPASKLALNYVEDTNE